MDKQTKTYKRLDRQIIELNIILSLLDNKMRVNQILGNGNKG